MIIDDINISTLKLMVLKMEGFYDLPSRKETNNENLNEAKDIVLNEKDATITLFGKYASASEMLNYINDLETLIKSSLKHNITLIGHDLSFIGVFKNGFETIPYIGGSRIKIIMHITITQ